jgi:replicative DNA helicase
MIDNQYMVPPQSIEIEQSVLSSCLIAGTAPQIVELIQPEHFYRSAHQKIFSIISKMISKGETVDLPMVADNLKKAGLLEEIGGAVYLARLTEEPIAVDIGASCKAVRDYASLRCMIEHANNAIKRCYEAKDNAEIIIDQCQREINAVEPGTTADTSTPFSELIHLAVDKIDLMEKNRGRLTGISTGFKHLDQFTCGLQKGDLIILAARPGMGKSALAIDIAKAASKEVGVEIFSLEMPKIQLAMRAISSESLVNSHKFRSGNFSEQDMASITRCAGRVVTMPISIDDTNVTHMEIRRRLRRAVKTKGVGLAIVDYLQLMEGNSSKNREREIADISRSLKMLAKELDIPILALSQLNRGLESRSDKRPLLSDLRESGSIEQDADVVMFIYREEMYCKESDKLNCKGKAELIIRKNRSGPLGAIKLTWLGESTTFRDYIESHDGYGM